ncbi:ARMT1-like domain-containing protein [Maridesulfovibrio zosterae]|uniref:ARMT1-like domain-containing protein n=1 Tax=Maridesulfovibrio zosterae TaxID=82171 RepID=UPI00041C12DE|nr:ARMT1-like domain-containing protein [Maridesulfovibrio zosterae]
MSILPDFTSIKDIRYGEDPAFDAWLLHFMTANHLENFMDPVKNASPEQLRFMVALDENQVFAPCSDWQFKRLVNPGLESDLLRVYAYVWLKLVKLVKTHVSDRYQRRLILNLCRHKFKHALDSSILIPWRLLKGMITIFLSRSGLDDPYRNRKSVLFSRGKAYVESDFFKRAIESCPYPVPECECLEDMRFELDMIELERIFRLASLPDQWSHNLFTGNFEQYSNMYSHDEVDFGPVRDIFHVNATGLKILYLPDETGGLMADLVLIKSLIRQGHSVILSLREGFCFDDPTFWDKEYDPLLAEALKGAIFISENRISKNALLASLRENSLVVISDGTRERLNLVRCSVTFARAWKESDLILAKGWGNRRRLIGNTHLFTRDVICFYRTLDGKFKLDFKAKSENVRKFSEADITAKSDEIIAEMQQARSDRKAVMFYSAVVGSIPGQVDTAIEVLNTFVGHLRERLDDTYIINPAEHFEEGMDADDLMFMWEKVQRSGFISIWRFQTYADIEKSFELMGKKVPPVWAGKDATYSTGCTKEMHIAQDVQLKHRELQIIGPSANKFLRRREYGVGRFSDVVIEP